MGLVASSKRGTAVLGYLADRGVSRELLDQVRVPVGLDLGHTTHAEIAVSVLAELVMLKANGALSQRPAGGATAQAVAISVGPAGHTHEGGGATAAGEVTPAAVGAPVTVIDLVCGMTVTADQSSRPFEYEGETYYFCCPACRAAFEKDPTQYIATK